MLDLRRLRLLRELAHRQTITAVADALSYTPSAVSQQLTVLEREVGVALLERSGRRVRLTLAGRALARHAEDVLAEVERAEGTLAGAHAQLVGSLRIGAFPSAARTLLPSALVVLGRDHPHLELMVEEYDPADAANALRSGALDVALTQDYDLVPLPDHAAVYSAVVLAEPMILASGRPPADPAEPVGSFHDSLWIMGKPGSQCRQAAERICHAAGFQPQVRHQSDDFPTVLALVAAFQGQALLPRMGTEGAPADVVLTPLLHTARVRVTHRRGADAHPAVTAFRRAVTQAVESYRTRVEAAALR